MSSKSAKLWEKIQPVMTDFLAELQVVFSNALARFLKVSGYIIISVILTPEVQLALNKLLEVHVTDTTTFLLVNAVLAALLGILKDKSDEDSLARKVL